MKAQTNNGTLFVNYTHIIRYCQYLPSPIILFFLVFAGKIIRSPYSDEVLCLDNDINTWVYADENAKNSSVQKVPAGTTFRRLRVPKKAEYQYVDGILEDGRVMRVVEEYWFSEPTAYQAMMDKDANQFDYHVVR